MGELPRSLWRVEGAASQLLVDVNRRNHLLGKWRTQAIVAQRDQRLSQGELAVVVGTRGVHVTRVDVFMHCEREWLHRSCLGLPRQSTSVLRREQVEGLTVL